MNRNTADASDRTAGVDAYFPLARRLLRSGRRTLGLIPVNLDAPLLPFSIRLATVLGDMGDTVAVVAPASRWKDLGIARRDRVSTTPDDMLTFSHGPRVTEVTLFRGPSGDIPRTLMQALPRLAEEYSRVLVDLSGLDVLSRQSEVPALLTGVVLVGAVGRTNEITLRRLRASLPGTGLLGVILVG